MSMTKEHLEQAGRLLLGEEWKRPLAKLLGPHHPMGARESLDPRLPFRWASGERPVPLWVTLTLATLLAERKGELEFMARECDRLSWEFYSMDNGRD